MRFGTLCRVTDWACAGPSDDVRGRGRSAGSAEPFGTDVLCHPAGRTCDRATEQQSGMGARGFRTTIAREEVVDFPPEGLEVEDACDDGAPAGRVPA